MGFLAWFGCRAIKVCDDLGKFGLFSIQVIQTFFTRGCSFSSLVFQIAHIGVYSRGVVMLTGGAIGAILAHHGYAALHRYGTDKFLGPLVYLSMMREFGSVVSAIMVTARAGSAMTAEIGSMSISEQIDALTTLSIDPIRYVVVPRVIGTAFILPFLSIICVFMGVSAGYVVAIHVLGVNAEMYIEAVKAQIILSDITKGLFKAGVFGLLISLICSYMGMGTRGGARGVGLATTQAVVFSCVTIFLSDYVLTVFLFD